MLLPVNASFVDIACLDRAEPSRYTIFKEFSCLAVLVGAHMTLDSPSQNWQEE